MPLVSWEESVTAMQPGDSVCMWSGLLLSNLLLIVANWYLPYKVRFTCAPLNNLALILLLGAVPASLIGLGTSLRSRWVQWPTVTLGLLLLLPMGLFTLVCGFDAIFNSVHGGDAAFKQIAELQTPEAAYRVYRTDGGAMTDFGLVLRREHTVLPGVRLVSVLMAQYHAADAKLDLAPGGMVRIRVMRYGKQPGFAREFPR